MNLLWCSNYSAQSAYAQQSKLMAPRIHAAGHNVTIFELSSGVSRPYTDNGMQIIGIGQDSLGNDMIQAYVQKFNIDAVITLVDVWRFQPSVWKDVPFYPYCPVDHHPLPPNVNTVLKGAARKVIAMSQFGVEELAIAGYDPLYCPLAYDPEIFHPRSDTRRGEIRKALGIPDEAFFVSFVGVNDSIPNRKGIPELLFAWKRFSERHPDAYLYLHTLRNGNLPLNSIGGVEITTLVGMLGLDANRLREADQIRYKAGMIEQSEVADVMAASDVLALPSRGEGFGVPLIEAQAVGTPVMTTRFAAGQELVFGGWKIDFEADWGWQNALQAKAGISSIDEQLERAYAMRGNQDLRKIAAAGAQPYAIDTVMRDYMLPTLDKIMADALERLAAA